MNEWQPASHQVTPSGHTISDMFKRKSDVHIPTPALGFRFYLLFIFRETENRGNKDFR